jgi:hypothetical protein
MRHASLDVLKQTATVIPAEEAPRTMTRKEKMERWADIVEAYGDSLRPFYQVEYLSRQERRGLKGDNTPLALAYADPVLRAQGLTSDNYDVGRTFFQMSEPEAHRLLCDCHYPGGMHSSQVAARIRTLANKESHSAFWFRLFERLTFHRH